jgi:hypothetical protein
VFDWRLSRRHGERTCLLPDHYVCVRPGALLTGHSGEASHAVSERQRSSW